MRVYIFSVTIIRHIVFTVIIIRAALFVNPDALPESERLAGKRKRKKRKRKKKTEVLTKQAVKT